MTGGADAPTPARYNADGTGRDTYIRRDPVDCFGKNIYKSEPRLITRMGEAGSVVGVPWGKKEKFEEVGGHLGTDAAFTRPARFIRPKAESYPVKVSHYTTMNQIVQNAYASSDTSLPGYLNNCSGYTGFKPRCPPANVGTADWATVANAPAVAEE